MKLQLKSLIILTFTLLIFGCKKKDKEKEKETEIVYSLPELVTNSASSITPTSAVISANITSDGNSPVTTVGFCWSTHSGPTISGTSTTTTLSGDSFNQTISGLQPGTIYYVRAYATNGIGTQYGNEITFKTGAAWYVAKQTFQYNSLYFTSAGIYGYVDDNVGIGFSADNGNTWTSITSNSSLYSTSELIVHGSYLFAVGNGGVYRTSNNGGSWIAKNNGIPGPLKINCIASNGTDLFISNNVNGIFRSSDNGDTWTAVNTGLNLVSNNQCTRLRFQGSTLFAGFYSNIYKTTNNGLNWTSSTTLSPPNYINDFLSSGNNFFAAYSSSGLFVSSDNGMSWNQSLTSSGGARSIIANNGDLYAAFNGSVFKQSAGATNWTNMSSGLNPATNKIYNTLGVKGNFLFVVEVTTSPVNFALYKYPLQ